MNDLLRGATAGAAATLPMTWSMELLHRLLPQEERYPLPPREIEEQVAQAAGVEEDLGERDHLWAALAAHFGYGATAGAAYHVLTRHFPGGPIAKGTTFGLVVWAGSYLGLLPALGILTPATQHPPRRTGLMLAAHAVWGSALGIFSELIENGSRGDGLHAIALSRPSDSDSPRYEVASSSVPGERITTAR